MSADDQLLTPREVADLFGVDPKTVTRWAKAGDLPCIRTLGGHRRYPSHAVRRLVAGAYEPERERAPGGDDSGV